MNNTKLSILITLFSCTSQGKNHYSLVSIDKTIELLAKRHETHVKRRWVFQCIHDIIATGFLSRRQRYKRHRDGTINQLSSITAFTLKGAMFLVSKRVSGARTLMKKILHWLKTKDKRFPTEKDIDKREVSPLTPSELEPFKPLTDVVGKPMPP